MELNQTLMTLEQFNNLTVPQKKHLLIDAKKVGEFEDEIATSELFQINNFYIEVSKSVTHRFRRILNTYEFKDIPPVYLSQVYKALVYS